MENRLSLKIRESRVYQVFENKNEKEFLRLNINRNVDMIASLDLFLNPYLKVGGFSCKSTWCKNKQLNIDSG